MKKLTNWISISSIALIILGLIHLAATIMVLPMFQNLEGEQFYVFLFMYLAAGLGTVLPGLISKLMINKLKKDREKGTWVIIMICSVFSLLMGLGAIVTMSTNPFAYMMLLIGLSLFIPTVLVKKDLK